MAEEAAKLAAQRERLDKLTPAGAAGDRDRARQPVVGPGAHSPAPSRPWPWRVRTCTSSRRSTRLGARHGLRRARCAVGPDRRPGRCTSAPWPTPTPPRPSSPGPAGRICHEVIVASQRRRRRWRDPFVRPSRARHWSPLVTVLWLGAAAASRTPAAPRPPPARLGACQYGRQGGCRARRVRQARRRWRWALPSPASVEAGRIAQLGLGRRGAGARLARARGRQGCPRPGAAVAGPQRSRQHAGRARCARTCARKKTTWRARAAWSRSARCPPSRWTPRRPTSRASARSWPGRRSRCATTS
ncbi:MAG: hypothetical protein MZU91_12590 [Desulfosudis oleivorans]|nr:hypothetical protein [Desulfosudis oleivorans]